MKRLALVLLPLVAVSVLFAAPPAWWTGAGTRIVEEEGEENNYAPANLGQLKHVAKMAKTHLDDTLPGGSGTSVSGLVAGFVTGTTLEEIALNYAPLNLGQLKAMAKPFYDRLHEAGYDTKANLIAHGFPDKWSGTAAWTGYYPWNPATPVAENYAPANIGQLKMTFSFDLTGFDSEGIDSDEDGLPDSWEMTHFGSLDADDEGDADGDGLTNLQEFQQESDPTDYYSQGSTTHQPMLSIVGGDKQAGLPGAYLEEPLTVEVRSGTGGALLVNAPVNYTVTSGSGAMAMVYGGTSPTSAVLVHTGSDGRARAFFKQPGDAKVSSTIAVTSGTGGPVEFTERTSESDGLWAHWAFNEGAGMTAADSLGITISGTLVNGTTWGSGFDGGGGVEFNGPQNQGGSNAYVTMSNPDDRSLDFGKNSFSISLWLKFTSTANPPGTSGRRIVSKGHHGWNPGYFVAAHNGGKISTGIGSTVSGSMSEATLVQTTSEYNDGKWHHVVVTNDWQSKKTRIYVDGEARVLEKDPLASGGVIHESEPDALDFSALTQLSATRTNIPFTVSSHSGGWDFFAGGVDDLKIYVKALDSTEVAAIYNEDKDEDGLPDWWEMEYLGGIGSNPAGDEDADGLTNLQEYQIGTLPGNPDSDGDGMKDGWEVDNGLDPNVDDAGGDEDGDGTSNLDEYNQGRNPNAGVVVDSGNVLGLKIYTPLEN